MWQRISKLLKTDPAEQISYSYCGWTNVVVLLWLNKCPAEQMSGWTSVGVNKCPAVQMSFFTVAEQVSAEQMSAEQVSAEQKS